MAFDAWAKRVLPQHGYMVLEARSGEEALEVAADSEVFALLITDVVMHGIGGQQLAIQLRQQYERLQVLYISRYTFDQLDKQYLSAKRDDYLAKPFTPSQLRDRVSRAFERIECQANAD
jgi:two-component system cell cycle sensor histidine kinase/response regulator CckA